MADDKEAGDEVDIWNVTNKIPLNSRYAYLFSEPSPNYRFIFKRLNIKQCLIYTGLDFQNDGFDSEFYF